MPVAGLSSKQSLNKNENALDNLKVMPIDWKPALAKGHRSELDQETCRVAQRVQVVSTGDKHYKLVHKFKISTACVKDPISGSYWVAPMGYEQGLF